MCEASATAMTSPAASTRGTRLRRFMPSMNSCTRYGPCSSPTAKVLAIEGWASAVVISASCLNRASISGRCSLEKSDQPLPTCLTTQNFSAPLGPMSARYTLPMPPSPRKLTMTYGPSRRGNLAWSAGSIGASSLGIGHLGSGAKSGCAIGADWFSGIGRRG